MANCTQIGILIAGEDCVVSILDCLSGLLFANAYPLWFIYIIVCVCVCVQVQISRCNIAANTSGVIGTSYSLNWMILIDVIESTKRTNNNNNNNEHRFEFRAQKHVRTHVRNNSRGACEQS